MCMLLYVSSQNIVHSLHMPGSCRDLNILLGCMQGDQGIPGLFCIRAGVLKNIQNINMHLCYKMVKMQTMGDK